MCLKQQCETNHYQKLLQQFMWGFFVLFFASSKVDSCVVHENLQGQVISEDDDTEFLNR